MLPLVVNLWIVYLQTRQASCRGGYVALKVVALNTRWKSRAIVARFRVLALKNSSNEAIRLPAK
jgi:hypothetical protein